MPAIRVERSEVRLRFGDEETPAPSGTVADGSKAEVIVAVLPAREVEIIAVGLVFSVDGGERRVQFRRHTGALTSSKEQFFIAQFPKLRPGSEVTYEVVVLFSLGGEQETLPSTEGGRHRLKFVVAGDVPLEPGPVVGPAMTAPVAAPAPKLEKKPLERSAQGRAVSDRGQIAPDVPLRLSHLGFGGKRVVLGESRTDHTGAFRIEYTFDAPPNLVIAALDEQGGELPLISTRHGAKERETIDVVVPERLVTKRVSEYERLLQAAQPFLPAGETLGAAVETSEHRDLSRLQAVTDWDARLLALAATAQVRGAETGVADKAMYGALRVGLPGAPEAIERIEPKAFVDAVRRACASGLIEMSADEIAQAESAFAAFIRRAFRQTRPVGGISTVGELLDRAGIDDPSRRAFEDVVMLRASGEGCVLDRASEAHVPRASIEKLRRQAELAEITSAHAPLIEQLLAETASLADLVERRLYDAEAWKERLGRLGADGLPQGETLDSFARSLAARVRKAFPAQVVRHRWASGESGLDRTVDEAALARLSRFANSESSIEALLRAGQRSALGVVERGATELAKDLGPSVPAEVASALFRRSTHLVGAALAEVAADGSRAADNRSILGHSAYLKDLSNWLKSSGDAGHAAAETLASRRPDIERAADTAVDGGGPERAIDLLTETLEHQTGGAPGAAAYDVVAAAKYPLCLPLDLATETLRETLAAAGTSLNELREAFHPRISLEDAGAVFFERLHLSPPEVALFTTPRSLVDAWYELYGYASEAAALDALQTPAALAERLEISEADLGTLQQRPSARPSRESLVRLNVVARLARKLGWSLSDVDAALRAFAPARAAKLEDGLPTALLYLAHAVELEATLGAPPEDRPRMVAIWSTSGGEGARAWFATALGLTSTELDAWIAALGFDPLGPLSDAPLRSLDDDVPHRATLPFVRAVRTLQGLGLSGEDAARLDRYPVQEVGRRLDLTSAELESASMEDDKRGTFLARLVPYLDLRKRLGVSGTGMAMLFRSASSSLEGRTGEEAAKRAVLGSFAETLAGLAKLDAREVARVAEHFDPGWVVSPSGSRISIEAARLRAPAHVGRIVRALDLAARIGARVEEILGTPAWTAPRPNLGVAEAVRAALRATWSSAKWRSLEERVLERMRPRKREALARHLVHTWGVGDASALGEHLLVDVDVDPATMTSRVEYAAAAVQRFVRRCLLGLESSDARALDAERWHRTRSFDVWKSARQAVLFPENLLDPNLRDDRTPLFLDFVRAVEGAESYAEAERAFLSYVRGCEELARHDVARTDRIEGWVALRANPGIGAALAVLEVERHFASSEGRGFQEQADRLLGPRETADWALAPETTVPFGASAIGPKGFAGPAPSANGRGSVKARDHQAIAARRFLGELVRKMMNDGAEAIFDPVAFGSTPIDFSDDARYAVLLREIFFHAPLAASLRATDDGRFDDAQRWLDALLRFWRGGPEAAGDGPCARRVMLACSDNLIAWGDHVLARSEGARAEAAQHYLLAADVLAARGASTASGDVHARLVALESTVRPDFSGEHPEVVVELLRDLRAGASIPPNDAISRRRRIARERLAASRGR